MLCHSARYVLDSYQYVSPILGLLPMILTRGIHIFGPLPKALLTSGTKVNFLHEGWVLLLNLSIRLNVRPLGKKICRCKNRNWFPRFFSWFVTTPGRHLSSVVSHITQPDTFPKAISLEKHKIQLWWHRILGFSLVLLVSKSKPIPYPLRTWTKISPLKKRKLQPDSPSQKFSAGIFHNFRWGVEFFFQKSPNHLDLQPPKDSTLLSGFFSYVTRPSRNVAEYLVGTLTTLQTSKPQHCPPPPTFGDRGAVRTFRSAKKKLRVETWKSTHGVVLWLVCVYWLAGCGVLVVVVYDVPWVFCSGGVYVDNQFGGWAYVRTISKPPWIAPRVSSSQLLRCRGANPQGGSQHQPTTLSKKQQVVQHHSSHNHLSRRNNWDSSRTDSQTLHEMVTCSVLFFVFGNCK